MRFLLIFFVGTSFASYGQYFLCSDRPTIYHDHEGCMELYKCDGRRKKIMDINALVPCRKCSWPEQIDSAFTDLVRFLGSSREEMETSLGTGTYSKSYYLTDFFVRSIGGKRIIGFEYIPKRPIEMIYEKIVNERFLKSIGIKV